MTIKEREVALSASWQDCPLRKTGRSGFETILKTPHRFRTDTEGTKGDMKPIIARNCIYFPLMVLRGQNIKKYIGELARLEDLSPLELAVYKKQKIKALLEFAYNNTVYYKNILRREIIGLTSHGSGISLKRIPYLKKERIMDDLEDFVCRNMRHSWRSTSGSTGTPLIFPKDRMSETYNDAMMHIAYSWHGINIGDKQARFWGTPIKRKDKYFQLLKDVLLNRKRLSVFKMEKSACNRFLGKLIRFGPMYFYGYANAIYMFASILESEGIDARIPGLERIISTGEVLFEYQRKKIQDVFGFKVINEFGSTENGILGFECEFGNMHVMPTVHIEVVDKDKRGFGELVVTELNSRSIPFIRYRLGDRGRFLNITCPCQRPFEIIEIDEGRVDDYILCPNGKIVYDAILAYILRDYVYKFKAYQENCRFLKIIFIPRKVFTSEKQNRVKEKLQTYLTRDMEIEFVEVSAIPEESSGKYRYFVSTLNKESCIG